MRIIVIAICAWALAGCATTEGPIDRADGPSSMAAAAADAGAGGTVRPTPADRAAARNFRETVARVEPVAEAFCRERTARDPTIPCDVRVGIDARDGMAANAFLTVDNAGQPLILFNMALVAMARNQDELAFAFGHEMGHLLGGHVHRALYGDAPEAAVNRAACDARDPGSLTTREAFEREADLLGAHIAGRAGYDPALGVRILARLNEGGTAGACREGPYLPSAERIETVVSALDAL